MADEILAKPTPVYRINMPESRDSALRDAIMLKESKSQERNNLIMNERKYLSPRNHIKPSTNRNKNSVNVLGSTVISDSRRQKGSMTPGLLGGRRMSTKQVESQKEKFNARLGKQI